MPRLHIPARMPRPAPTPSAPIEPRQLQLLGDRELAALCLAALWARCADDVGRRHALRRRCDRTLDLTRW